jgi:hypothetical protein
MSEMIITVAITVVAVAGVTQLLFLSARQQRLMVDGSLATHEAGNVMEQLMSCPWDDVVSGGAVPVALSDTFRQACPDAELHVEVVPEDDGQEVCRLEVQISWTTPTNQKTEPVRLVAWRFRDKEALP